MEKTLENILKRARRAALPLTTAAVMLASSSVAYYGIQQTNGEHRTLQRIEEILGEIGENTNENMALIMGMIKKESSFYEGAVGRDNEAGLLQLSPVVAQQNGLRISREPLKESSRIDKLFYTDQDTKEDERFDAEKNLRAGIDYFFELVESFQNTYGMDKTRALQFGSIAFNLGPTNVRKLFGLGYSKYPEEFIRRLSTERLEEHGISDRKREVTVDYYTRTSRFKREYEQRIAHMREHDSPSLGEYLKGIFRSFGEIYQRLKN